MAKDVERGAGAGAGAGGTFQITGLSIEAPNGKSVHISELVDQGIHFQSDDHLKTYISKTFNIPVANVDLSED